MTFVQFKTIQHLLNTLVNTVVGYSAIPWKHNCIQTRTQLCTSTVTLMVVLVWLILLVCAYVKPDDMRAMITGLPQYFQKKKKKEEKVNSGFYA